MTFDFGTVVEVPDRTNPLLYQEGRRSGWDLGQGLPDPVGLGGVP